MTEEKSENVGIAFSGGGIRSAALCSGVLRRLLQKKAPIDYISCVSGGGYIGASYLDWKYRNECKDDPEWHKKYFDHLREHSNPMCDCRNPCIGFLHVVRILKMLFVTLILSLATNFMFVIPTALATDYLFGDLLRGSFICPSNQTHNFTETQVKENFEIASVLNFTPTGSTIECVSVKGELMHETIEVFIILIAITVFTLVMKTAFSNLAVKNFFTVASNIMLFLFAMVFLPWVIEEYVVVLPMWANVLVIILSVLVWMWIPRLSDRASWILIIFIFAYVVKWRVYKTAVLNFEYSDERFLIMLWVCGVLMWLYPLLGSLQQSIIFNQNRWMLERTFFSPESAKSTYLLSCGDFVSWASCCLQKDKPEALYRPLTLGDLACMKPEYKCNMSVNNWRRSNKKREKEYGMLVMSSSEIERLDRRPEEKQFNMEGFLRPHDVTLATAMATSAAYLAPDLGRYGDIPAVRDLQVLLGLGMGNSLVSQPGLSDHLPCIIRVIPMFIQLLLAVPLIGTSVAWYVIAPDYIMHVFLLLYLTIMAVLTVIAALPTGMERCKWLTNFTRWCNINIYHVRLIRKFMDVVHVGLIPPPVMDLSDGGHTENLALLPLLKLRLPRIVVVNGGALSPEANYASNLLFALQQARDHLRCSFVGLDGRDVLQDIREKFVEKPYGERPRHYRFVVHYYEWFDFADRKVGEGEVILLAPRHPSKGVVETESYTWKDFDDEDLEEEKWGQSPVLEPSDVDHLTGCCFECCHWRCFSLCSIFGKFPFHSTINQMFTPEMFAAYHREGYRACAEGKADLFLLGKN